LSRRTPKPAIPRILPHSVIPVSLAQLWWKDDWKPR
jgi:hypothetical protein